MTVIYAQEGLQLSVDKLQEYKFKNWDSVEYYGTQILELASNKQYRERGIANKFLGDTQWSKYGNYDSAISFYDIAHLHLVKVGDSSLLATLYNNYGVANKSKANYGLSLDYFSKALEYSSIDSLSRFTINLINNIGEVSFMLGNLEEAEKYYLYSHRLAIQTNDSSLIERTYFYLGNLASAKNESPKAIDYFSKSITYLSQHSINSSYTIYAIAREYHSLGEQGKAIPYYREAIQEAITFNSRSKLALLYLGLGQALLTMEEPDPENYIDQAIEIATEFKQKRVLLHAHQFLAWYYEEHNQYRLALENFRWYQIYSDSILNESSLVKLNALNVKFNTAQNEKKITSQELEIELKNAAIVEERIQKIIIAAGLLFIILIGGLLYFRSQTRQKAEVQQAVIREKELGLKTVFMATEMERQRISKDLHDGVGQQISGVKMQLESLTLMDNTQQEQKKLIVEHLQEAAQEIRQISHQLMPRSLEEEGLIPSLEDLFNKTFTGTSITCSFEHHKAKNRYPQEVELSLFRITQELLNNILKHANANNVHVQLYKIKNKLVMTVEDDGVGFNVSEKSKGHGLLNIKSRIETVNGNVEFESSDTSETVITLSIPINTANNG